MIAQLPAQYLQGMNLIETFRECARQSRDLPAVFWGERAYSYNEIDNGAQDLTRRLVIEWAVRPGDRVGLWLKNCPEFVTAVFGVLGAGAILVPINNFLKPDEVAYILDDAGIEVLLTDEELGAHEAAIKHRRPSLKVLRLNSLESCQASAPARPIVMPRAPQEPAVIIYTSGTTGHPKGAVLAHANLLHNVESCRQVLAANAQDRMVVILPLFHSYMLCVGLLLPLLSGGSMILIKSLHPLKSLLHEIQLHRGTILPAIPQFYRSLMSLPTLPELPLRLCISGAAPLPLQFLHEFEAKFGIPLIEGYGLSEASPVVAKNPLNGQRKPGSIGLPIPHVEMSVQDTSGNCLAAGEVGEICVRGGNVMLGYWRQPEETAKVMRGRWLLTGDMGYHDAEGYYYITDRKKDMLLVNGMNVYPREIEEVLYQVAGIREAAVVGLPDPKRGEQPVAFVAAEGPAGLDEQRILHFARERLADYKVPRRVVFVPALPRNATGKILKTTLREWARSPHSRP